MLWWLDMRRRHARIDASTAGATRAVSAVERSPARKPTAGSAGETEKMAMTEWLPGDLAAGAVPSSKGCVVGS